MTTPAVPTTAALRDTIVAQIAGSISQTIPLLPKAFTRVLAAVLAAAIVIVYKYASWQFLQLFVAHATDKETEINGKKIRPLVEWGRLDWGRGSESGDARRDARCRDGSEPDGQPRGGAAAGSHRDAIHLLGRRRSATQRDDGAGHDRSCVVTEQRRRLR